MRAQRGQSLVEFAIAASVLAVLPLGMVLIARFHDVQLRTIQAARHAAYDSVWWHARRTPEQSQALLRERLFTEVHWQDPWGAEPLLDAESDVDGGLRVGVPPGRAAAVTRFMLQPLVSISGMLGSGFDVDQNGFHTATVRVEPRDQARLPRPLDALGIELRESLAVLGDSWSASGPAHVKRRVSGLVPTSLGAEARALLDPVEATIAVLEPSIRRLCWGRIDPEAVPSDRLSPAPARSAVAVAANAC